VRNQIDHQPTARSDGYKNVVNTKIHVLTFRFASSGLDHATSPVAIVTSVV
jgi:hypothetical protein